MADGQNGHDRGVRGERLFALGGGANPRRLSPEQELVADIVAGVVEDLTRDPDCALHRLAVAWVVGRHECGCPHETPGITFEEAAGILGGGAATVTHASLRRYRAELLRGHSSGAPRRSRCAARRTAQDPRQMALFWQLAASAAEVG